MIVADDRRANGNELANIPSASRDPDSRSYYVSSSKREQKRGKDVGGHRFAAISRLESGKNRVTNRETNQPRPRNLPVQTHARETDLRPLLNFIRL